MALEDQIGKFKSPVDLSDSDSKSETSERYQKGLAIHAQPLLITAIHSAFKQVVVTCLQFCFTKTYFPTIDNRNTLDAYTKSSVVFSFQVCQYSAVLCHGYSV